ncbi:tyrosine-type recombinase/integrase [Halobium palmae]|uniref:Tyrosine-type recombinase/integrase n=1 Tax=Halobium palmae TaxID=1776492 RepID=A0ABD5RXM9_9EURY
MTETKLETIDPHEAVELYLSSRRDELADSTLRTQKCRLNTFAEWCGDKGISNLNDLSGRNLHEYKLYLRDHHRLQGDTPGVSPITLRTRLSSIRVFLRFCHSIDAVDETLPEKIVLPQVDREERYREETIDTEFAKETIKSLRETRYGLKEHIAFEFLWKTGCRLGALYALDVDDIDFEEMRVHIEHRPEQGTSLKNGRSGERVITLSEDLLKAIETFIDVNRTPTTDDYDRRPLLTTRHGRADKSTLRCWVYRAQQPCYHSNECPHDEDIPTCGWARTYERDKCPSTTMPHNIRRGAITYFLSNDIPKRAVSDRTNVSGDVLDTHYDQRSETGKAEQRRKFFE